MGIRNLFDPGSHLRDGKIRIRDKHPGSATLVFVRMEKGANICKWAILKRSGQNIVARPNIKTNVVDVKLQAQTLST
jgi:hypothetical protein